MRRFLQLFRPAALSAVVLAALLVDTGTVCAEVVYRFGVVPQFAPRQLANIWVPILKELESRTGLKFKMVGSPNIPKFEISFLAGEFDFAYMNPYHAMLASMQRGYVPLNRDHGRKLSGVLVVKKDDPIGDVKELDGMTISFPAPNALGASLLMRTDLAKIVDIKIKPLYVRSHSSVYLNVLLGKTSAGGGVMSTLKRQDQKIQDGLRVIYQTREIAPHPVTAHPRVPAEHMELVRKAFLDMGQSEHGATLLAKVPFKEIGPASLDEYLELASWGLEEHYVRDE